MQIGDLQHQGIRTESAAASFYLDTSITGFDAIGKPVSITGNFTVGFGSADDEILGSSKEKRRKMVRFNTVAL